MDKMVTLMSTLQQLYFYSPEGLAMVRYPGAQALTLLRAAGQVLGQRDAKHVAFYLTDLKDSVLECMGGQASSMKYTGYGYEGDSTGSSLLRFNGQRKESTTGHYLLGDGYRGFNPVLMRFNSPDSLSPFGAGGVNTYCYCGGDPVNRADPSGHEWKSFFGIRPRRSSIPDLIYQGPFSIDEPPTKYTSRDSYSFAHHITSRDKDKFADFIAYQGKGTGARIDKLFARDKFLPEDLELVQSVTVSLHRDGLALISNMKTHPIKSYTDTRFIAANWLAEGVEKLELLSTRIKLTLEAQSRARANREKWLKANTAIRKA